MNRSSLLMLMTVLVIMIGLASCGGGDGTQEVDNNPNLVPDVSVQTVDHRYRTATYSDANLNNDPIFALIASANSSLDVAATAIDRQEVVEALLQEARAGTQIRIITEKAYYDDLSYKPFYDQLEDINQNNGNIEVRTDLDGAPRIMHARFLVIDQARVVTGSYNWESSRSTNTYGDVITLNSTEIAAAFTNQFNQMFVERNFGVHKRDDTKHTFLVGSGNGIVEVYFGPNDQPLELLSNEINSSANVYFAIQQFKDFRLANTMLNWISSNANFNVIGMFNDIGALGDAEENAVYNAFENYAQDNQNIRGGTMSISDLAELNTFVSGTRFDPITQTDIPVQVNAMNHKLLYADRALAGGSPSVTFYTGNYSALGFDQNDEVMVIMRGSQLARKYYSGADLSTSLPPTGIENADDIKEFDQLFALHPMQASAGSTPFREFLPVSSGIILGTINNFQPTITIDNGNGEFDEINIDVYFEIEGTYFFNDFGFGPVAPFADQDAQFEENEAINPDHRFMMVVPAGDIILRTIVLDTDGSVSSRFQPTETEITIGPGGVREVSLNINQSQDTLNAGSGGGGGAA
ncbi:hypothetical protein KDL29_15730 [bacterium]|nr:hypothetical protein [bacterium]